MELGRHARSDPSRALCEMPRRLQKREPLHCRRDQQPEREKRRKRGASRSAGVRRGKEDQGQEAAYSRRHARPADPRHRARRRYPGPRRRCTFMATMFGLYPFLLKLYADGGYQGPKFRDAVRKYCTRERRDRQALRSSEGFVVLPKRWVVERTFAWLGRCRRLAKDWENLNRKALAFLRSPPSGS